MSKKEEKELAKLYVMVPRRKVKTGRVSVCLVNANKLRAFKGNLPTKEILRTHFQIEKLRLEKDKTYTPQPLYLEVEKEKFFEMYKEVYGKDTSIGEGASNIALTLGQSVPCCIITIKKD